MVRIQLLDTTPCPLSLAWTHTAILPHLLLLSLPLSQFPASKGQGTSRPPRPRDMPDKNYCRDTSAGPPSGLPGDWGLRVHR